ncbi:MAG: glycosyltransferase family 2 protein [Pirellulaceae bacterium]
MKIAAICCTYKRPGELATVIECFLRQDYPPELRELIVLDDADQYDNQEGHGWRIASLPFRFRTLGEKRNASAGLVSADVDAYCVWDDDDIYLPWHMSAAAAALADADYTIPTVIYNDKRNRLQRKANQYLFHGAWAFRRTAFEQVGGYPFIQSGQDQGLLRRFKAAKLRRADPIQHDPRPSYVYRWFTSHSTHISAMGTDGYERLGQNAAERIAKVEPCWDVNWLTLATAELKETQT